MSISPDSAAGPVTITQNVGPVTFTLTNNGPGALTGINLSVSPAGSPFKVNGFEITANGCTGTVAAGATCTFNVQADVTSSCVVPFSGTLAVAADAIDTPLTVKLLGNTTDCIQ
jgi:hypothetical protein